MKRFTAGVYQIQSVYLKQASKKYENISYTKLIYQIIAAQNWESSMTDIETYILFWVVRVKESFLGWKNRI